MSEVLVGITLSCPKGSHYELRRAYADRVQAAGAEVIFLPWHDPERAETMLHLLDGLLLAGGQDIAVERWGGDASAKEKSQAPHLERDAWEFALLDAALKEDLPVFGICRGFQLLNVYCGGTLYPELKDVLGDAHPHEGADYEQDHVAELRMHEIVVNEDQLAKRLWEQWTGSQAKCFEVNSFHHQAANELGAGLIPLVSSTDGLVEAVALAEARWVRAVQWHPEVQSAGPVSTGLFAGFVAACEEAAKRKQA